MLQDESFVFEKQEQRVKPEWTEYIKGGGTISEPEQYIIMK